MTTYPDRNDHIIPDLLGTINSIKLYSHKHPQTRMSTNQVMDRLEEIFQTEDRLLLGVFNDNMLVNQKPVVGIGRVAESMAKVLDEVGIDQLVFLKGLTQEEFSMFLVETFGTGSGSGVNLDYPHIMIGRITPDETKIKEEDVGSIMDLDTSRDFIGMLENLDPKDPFNFKAVKDLSQDLMETFRYSTSPLKYLAEVKSEDEYTYVHTINVALLSMSLAKHMGITGSDLMDIIYAALMHDVGKMLVPKSILNKRGPLTPDEFEVIKAHTLNGVMYLSNQKGIPRIAILTALEHHIKYNGGGYPNITNNWKPHFVSQIISIADIYDALRSNRPYRARLEHEEIIGILRHDAGNGLNPEMVDVFIDMLGDQSKEAV
jgi:putative nucleotidyltransferase with HDIG domain